MHRCKMHSYARESESKRHRGSERPLLRASLCRSGGRAVRRLPASCPPASLKPLLTSHLARLCIDVPKSLGLLRKLASSATDKLPARWPSR